MGVKNSTESKPEEIGFIPTEVHGVIITNRMYDKNRPYKDIEYVVENAATIKRIFTFLKITNITEFKDSTIEDFETFYLKTRLKYMKANTSSDTKILYIIYYAGHGEMFDGSTTT
jgi:hypothetical protein